MPRVPEDEHDIDAFTVSPSDTSLMMPFVIHGGAAESGPAAMSFAEALWVRAGMPCMGMIAPEALCWVSSLATVG